VLLKALQHRLYWQHYSSSSAVAAATATALLRQHPPPLLLQLQQCAPLFKDAHTM